MSDPTTIDRLMRLNASIQNVLAGHDLGIALGAVAGAFTSTLICSTASPEEAQALVDKLMPVIKRDVMKHWDNIKLQQAMSTGVVGHA
jgi:hypothetical protein